MATMARINVISAAALFLASTLTAALAGSLTSGMAQSFRFSLPGPYGDKPITMYY
jgi:hypothetical protein